MLSKVKQVGLGVAALSGAAVRLSGSGLGCPDWPKCYGNAYPPLNTHALIEFSNRLITAPVSLAAGAAAAKAQAAAVKAVGSGTAGDVTTDYFGNGYEVTVTKPDGSTVEIHLDSSFEVMGPPGGHGGAPPGWVN